MLIMLSGRNTYYFIEVEIIFIYMCRINEADTCISMYSTEQILFIYLFTSRLFNPLRPFTLECQTVYISWTCAGKLT